jgi:hypothetical protein
MSAKNRVRIVKKGQLKQAAKAQPKTSSARDTARDMVKTVTNWVNELQQKRRAETANALKLMSDTPRPSEI